MLTLEQMELVDSLVSQGLGARKIEKATGIPRGQIQHYMIIKEKPSKQNGANRFKKISTEKLEAIAELRKTGMSDQRIADEIGLTKGQVLHYRRQLEGYTKDNEPEGVYVTDQLTDYQKDTIKLLRKHGYGIKAISDMVCANIGRVRYYCGSADIKKGDLGINSVCEGCGKEFQKDNLLKKYCSNECAVKYQFGYGDCKVCGKRYLKGSQYSETCSIQCLGESRKLTDDQFEERLESIFGDEIVSVSKYDGWYSEVTVMCKLCGKLITRQSATFIHDETGCTDCSVSSRGERDILLWLNANGISHSRQYTFKDLKNKSRLRFDFAVFKNNKLKALIEFDGRQHFHPVDYFGGDVYFNRLKMSDEAKTNYALKNKIKLIRIPYFKKSSIPEILADELREIGVINGR